MDLPSLLKKNLDCESLHDNTSEIVKLFQYINDAVIFLDAISRIKGELQDHEVRLTERGLIEINDELKIHPAKYLLLTPGPNDGTTVEAFRRKLLKATKDLNGKEIDRSKVYEQVVTICKEHRVQFESQRKEILTRLCSAFGANDINEIEINGKKIFVDLLPHELDRVGKVLSNAGQDYNEEFIEIVNRFAGANNCDSAADYCSFTEFANVYYCKQVKLLESRFKNELRAAKVEAQNRRERFEENNFCRDRGIPSGRPEHLKYQPIRKIDWFRSEAMKMINNIDKLNSKFQKLNVHVTRANESSHPRFRSNVSATYLYYKHKNFGPVGKLTVDQYFMVARELFQQPFNRSRAVLSQEGDCWFHSFNLRNGAFGSLVERFTPNERVYKIATVLHKDVCQSSPRKSYSKKL